jgi:Zn-finger nucleic acid-binding protein
MKTSKQSKHCPKCTSDLQSIDFNGVEIDRCTGCFGLWFDHLEKDDLQQLKGAEHIDIGDVFVGAIYNEVNHVKCPKCRTEMRHITHHEPFEIKFESCPNCLGKFFDAGEFRDYLGDEILAQFKQVLEQPC